MNAELRPDPAFEVWLKSELDTVPEPSRAVQGAVETVATTSQRTPWLLRVRRLVRPGSRPPQSRHMPPPETVLWADSAARGGGSDTSLAPTLSVSRGLPLPIAVVALLLAALIVAAAAFLTIGPGAGLLGGGGDPGSMPTVTPLRVIGPAVDGGRDIDVAVDGTGHFLTISDAVAYAEPGDRISIGPGSYRENVVVEEAISISGVGGRTDVIVRPAQANGTIFTLNGTDATLAGLTVYGDEIGTAIVVIGGAPLLDDLIIRAEGEQRLSNPTDPRQGVQFEAGTQATLQNSDITSFVAVDEATAPTIDRNAFRGTCIRSHGPGANPTISNNEFEASACPDFSIIVSGGSNATLTSNRIRSPKQIDGIKVVGEGSRAQISSQVITGGDYGIWVGSDASATLTRSLVSEATTGVAIVGADAVLDSMEIRYNGTGLVIDEGAAPNLTNNVICGNDVDIEQRVQSPVSEVGNTTGSPCPAEPDATLIEPIAPRAGGGSW